MRKLVISGCSLITELSGLRDLVALEELNAHGCSKLSKLPDMHKLINLRVINLQRMNLRVVNLQVFDIQNSSITEVAGFDS